METEKIQSIINSLIEEYHKQNLDMRRFLEERFPKDNTSYVDAVYIYAYLMNYAAGNYLVEGNMDDRWAGNVLEWK